MLHAQDEVTATPDWDRRARVLMDRSAYLLLAVSFVLVMSQPQPPQDRAVAVALTVVAGALVTAYLRVPAMHGGRIGASALYLLGYLVVGAAMALHDPLFFPFLIGAFLHVFNLQLPTALTFAGVALTSVVLNGLIAYSDPDLTARDVAIFGIVVVVQTVAIGGGVIVGRRTSELLEERRRTVAELRAALDENAGLHAQLMVQAREAGVHDERQRLAQEIHDTLAQGLTGIITQLEAAVRPRAAPETTRRHIDTALELARVSLTDARRSVHALIPEPLDHTRLPDALANIARRWSSHTGVAAEVSVTGDAEPLHPSIEVTLLRVAQEALTNVGRHARASRAVVTLSYMHDVATLDVRDDGVGFATADGGNGGDAAGRPGGRNGDGAGDDRGGYGLTTMRQRLASVAGTLTVESAAGAGTSISATVPAVPASAGDDRSGSDR